MEWGDDAKYHVKRLDSTSFQMPSGNLFELNFVLNVLDLMSLLAVFCMTILQCFAESDGQQVTIRDINPGFG